VASEADITINQRVRDALMRIEVQLLDHLIVTSEKKFASIDA